MEESVDPIVAVGLLVQRAVASAFPEAADTDPQVRRSERADLQADLAMGLARRLKQPPRAIAEKLLRALPENPVIDQVELAGAGFLNITLRAAWLGEAARRATADDRLGVPRTDAPDRVVIDYSHPNVAKEMHVGHLRSTVIGDALARVLAWRGHTVIRQNHIGDWGTPFGMLIEQLTDLGDARAEAEMRELNAFYRTARARFDNEVGFADRARARVVALQAGDPETLAKWRVLVALSTRYFEAIYARLGVTLESTDIAGESFYNDRLAPLANELEARGYARVSDGALCAFPGDFKNREGQPVALMLRKRDGGFGYAATDLAAIRYRLAELGASRILYVIGAPQTQHVAMIIAAARECGWLTTQRAEHVSFGSVLGTDGKIMKSREGESFRLIELVDCALARAAAVALAKSEPGAEVDPDLANMIGIGAIKYADLSTDRVKDYIFDVERMVSFDGNTAGYVQYAHARARSILRKAGEVTSAPIVVGEPAERALVLQLLDLGAAVRSVEASLEPHRLVNYAYAVACSFTAFYDACPILKAEPGVRASRLAIVGLTARTIAQALELLGIAAPERM